MPRATSCTVCVGRCLRLWEPTLAICSDRYRFDLGLCGTVLRSGDLALNSQCRVLISNVGISRYSHLGLTDPLCVKVALHLSFQGSGGGSGRRCCARQQLRARESFTRWCHPASPRPGDSSTSRQEGSPPYSIQPDCWCSVACAMLLLEVVDRGAEVEVVLPVPTTVLWRRF